MDRLRVNYSKILYLDVPKYATKLPSAGPPRRQAGTIEKPVISAAVSAASSVSNTAKILKEIVDLADLAKTVPVTLVGGSGPMVTGPKSISQVTIGAGSSVSAFATVGVSFGAGLYASNSPELGIYTSAGGGIWTNAGASGSLQLTYVFGPPSSFAGLSWGVGVDCDVPGVGIGLSAMVLFGASGPPYEFLGWCFGVGAGVSVLPVDFTFQVSSTKLIKLTP